jgi:hypothetical protein
MFGSDKSPVAPPGISWLTNPKPEIDFMCAEYRSFRTLLYGWRLVTVVEAMRSGCSGSIACPELGI